MADERRWDFIGCRKSSGLSVGLGLVVGDEDERRPTGPCGCGLRIWMRSSDDFSVVEPREAGVVQVPVCMRAEAGRHLTKRPGPSCMVFRLAASVPTR